MTLSFITERTESILTRSKFSSNSFNIPNDHKCFDKEQLELWNSLAKALGIDLEKAEYTIRVVTKEGGELPSLYTPYVGSNGTEAILVWGKVSKPLAELDKSTIELSIGGGKRPALELFFPELDDTLLLTFMLAKGDSEQATKEHKELLEASEDDKKNILRKALRANKLHLYLSQSFEKSLNLKVFEGQSVQVTGYKTRNSPWGIKYDLITSKGDVAANSQLAKKLSRKPEITPEKPATLTVGRCSGKNSSGHDIFPATLVTFSDIQLDLYDFGQETTEESFAF